jgi:hypothetical protein
MKALPITHKATRSPLKMSGEALVANDQQAYKQFNDVASDYAAGRKEGLKMTQKKGSQRAEPTSDKPPVDLKQPPIDIKEQTPAKV